MICEETDKEPPTPTSAKLAKKDCEKFYSPICFKFDVVSLVDRLSRKDKIGLYKSQKNFLCLGICEQIKKKLSKKDKNLVCLHKI